MLSAIAFGCGDGGGDDGTSASSNSSGSAGSSGGSSSESLSITGSPPPQILAGTPFSYAPTVSNPNGLVLSFSAVNLPDWASLDASTGTVSGTPGAGDIRVYSGIRITVSGGGIEVTTSAFSVEVVATATGSAILTWSQIMENTDGSPLTNLSGFRVYWGPSLSNLSNTATVNGTGTMTYVVDNLTSGTWYFAATSFNANGVESGYSNIASKTIM